MLAHDSHVLCMLQIRRLALASCCHPRLGVDALLVDFDVVVKIGQLVVAQSLLTRDEVAVELAAKQRARALRGEAILLGTVVHFAQGGEAEYVGGDKDAEQGCYTFRFGVGATAKTERMHLARRKRADAGWRAETERIRPAPMEPEQWSVSPCDAITRQGGIKEGIPPSS